MASEVLLASLCVSLFVVCAVEDYQDVRNGETEDLAAILVEAAHVAFDAWHSLERCFDMSRNAWKCLERSISMSRNGHRNGMNPLGMALNHLSINVSLMWPVLGSPNLSRPGPLLHLAHLPLTSVRKGPEINGHRLSAVDLQ